MENIRLNNEKMINEIAKSRIGETALNSSGSKMKITQYVNSNNVTVEFENGHIAKNIQYGHFVRGNVRNPHHPTVCGMGYLGKGKYKATDKNNKQTKQYIEWQNMLARCYSLYYQEKHPSYKGCTVCEEWINFQNFGKWFDENYYEIDDERMELDKDILYKNNKIYSPKTCIFVPQSINLLFIKRDSERGDLPIGVIKIKDNYRTQCSYGEKSKWVGTYNTVEEAFNTYKKYKEQLIKDIAAKYKEKIPKKLYNAMIRYEVEITD